MNTETDIEYNNTDELLFKLLTIRENVAKDASTSLSPDNIPIEYRTPTNSPYIKFTKGADDIYVMCAPKYLNNASKSPTSNITIEQVAAMLNGATKDNIETLIKQSNISIKLK
jgi:hypothetical protein